MQLTTQYKKGIVKLAALLALLCFFIAVVNRYSINEPQFTINEAVQCSVENHKLILAEAKEKEKHKYRYNVNTLTDFQGYQLGLKLSEIDLLMEYRKSGSFIYNLKQFQSITNMEPAFLDSISPYLIFAKQKIKKPIGYKSTLTLKTKDINKVTALELKQLGLPHKIAYRIVNYRSSIGGYKSMEQLEKVWDIEKKHLDVLNETFSVSN